MVLPGIGTPSSSGGLMRYNEEYKSGFKIKPSQIIIFVVCILVFVGVLKIFFPIIAP